jgi:hypothetical protein
MRTQVQGSRINCTTIDANNFKVGPGHRDEARLLERFLVVDGLEIRKRAN